MPSLEPEMEDLLLRLVPGIQKQWRGANAEQIEELELAAGRELPRFYRWFQETMGADMGPLAFPSRDMSAATIATLYREHQVHEDLRILVIGIEADQMMPTELLYDLDQPVREDALVSRRPRLGAGQGEPAFETFREMLAWSALRRMRIFRSPHQCEGTLLENTGVVDSLIGVMESLEFRRPIPTGSSCGLFERSDVALACYSTPGNNDGCLFQLGGDNEGELRRILGEISTSTSIKVRVDSWTPASST